MKYLNKMGLRNNEIKTKINVISIGEKYSKKLEEKIEKKSEEILCFLEKSWRKYHLNISKINEIKEKNVEWEIFKLTDSPSFGSVKNNVIDSVCKYSSTEGVFFDPIYNSKAFNETLRICDQKNLTGNR